MRYGCFPNAYRIKMGDEIIDVVYGQDYVCVDDAQYDRVTKQLEESPPLSLIDWTAEKEYGANKINFPAIN